MPYRTLSADNIEATIEKLHKRIAERFPNRGIVKLCGELLTIAREDRERLSWVSRPNLLVRTGVGVAITLGVGGVIWTLLNLGPLRVTSDAFDLIQGVEAILNIVALAGASIWFLLNLESNMRRDRVLADLHELRSIAHVVDMHQLTKDPTQLLKDYTSTKSSDVHDMSELELLRISTIAARCFPSPASWPRFTCRTCAIPSSSRRSPRSKTSPPASRARSGRRS